MFLLEKMLRDRARERAIRRMTLDTLEGVRVLRPGEGDVTRLIAAQARAGASLPAVQLPESATRQ